MKLINLRISNFRRCKDVDLQLGDIHAIVGSNNAGKSTILKALDFLFNASVRGMSNEAFWNGESESEISVEAIFTDLTDSEVTQLRPYLRPDGSFKMSRIATRGGSDGDMEEEGAAIRISQRYCKPRPKQEWLQSDNITAANIKKWQLQSDSLVVNTHNFLDVVGESPKVDDWERGIQKFIEDYPSEIEYEEFWYENPKGYSGVLKACLPFFVLIPAVREVSEEAKVLKTNPFGKLLGAVIGAIAAEKKAELEEAIMMVTKQLNRVGGKERLPQFDAIESELNTAIARVFVGCDLEIEFASPNFESLLGSPRLFVDDGFRGQVEHKGHGLQRAVIFAILRNYAAVVTGKGDLKRRTLILAVEEPELYMHPHAQRAVRKLFKDISGGGDQVIYTTHSALLVEVEDFDEVIRVEGIPTGTASGKGAVCSACKQLAASRMVDDEVARHPRLAGRVTAESIREHYSHAYNRSRNEGFFAKKVILVEGETEEYSLPIYAAALGFDLDLLGISIVETGGKGPMDRLFRIYNELGIPVFMLFDYDDGNVDQKIIAKSKELLDLVSEPTDTPVDFYGGTRAACFQKNWEQRMQVEVADYETLQNNATQLLGTVAGKPIRARYMARELTKRTPPFIPPSIKKCIELAVAVECGTSCLQKNADR